MNTISHSKIGSKAFNSFQTSKSSLQDQKSFILTQMQSQEIDEFFGVEKKAKGQKFSIKSAIGAAIGVAIPLLKIAKKRNPNIEIRSLKTALQATNIEYGHKELLKVGLGGILGGLFGGLLDTKETKKLKKIKEATFQAMNVTYPTLFIASAIKAVEKVKQLNNPVGKIAATAVGITAGIFTSVTSMNLLEDTVFDKYKIEKNKKFKPKDLAVYADDCISGLVLAKIPFVNKLPMGQIIPALFTWIGYNVGEKEKGN